MECIYARLVICIKPVRSSLMGKSNSNSEDEFRINPYELKILKEIIELKKTSELPFTLTCVSMGTKTSESVLRRALAMGADEAVLISDSSFAGSDTVATSYILSEALKKLENVKLVICGSRSIDGETGQIPASLSERLHCALYTNATEICSFGENTVTFVKDDENKKVVHKGELPAVISYNGFSINDESVSLMALKRAKKKEIYTMDKNNLNIDISRCGVKGSKTKVSEVNSNFTKKSGEQFLGTSDEIAHLLTDILKGVHHD